jgi:hypothetical protein
MNIQGLLDDIEDIEHATVEFIRYGMALEGDFPETKHYDSEQCAKEILSLFAYANKHKLNISDEITKQIKELLEEKI